MKNIQQIIKIFFLLLLVACTENDLRDVSFVNDITAPANVAAVYNITQDNTGSVTITPNADGAVSFEIFFGDGTTAPAIVPQGESAFHVYAEGTYQVKIVAVNLTGVKTEATQQLIVSFKAPQNLVVVVENDAAISKQVNITANADFATFFEFNSGETGVTQPVVSGNIGSTISYTYQNAGTYDIMVEAKGGAIATTKYEMSFEVTEILAPIASAPTPPSRSTADVVSIFSDVYTDVSGSNFYPNWGQATQYTAFDLNGDAIIQYTNLNYQGIDIGSEIDASSMETLHIDIWTADATSINVYPLPNGVQPADERFVTLTLVPNQWNSFDIPMTDFTNQGLPVNTLKQFKFVGSGTVFIDNLYFYKAPSGASPPLLSDNFEGNGNIPAFSGDAAGASVIDNPFNNAGNFSSKVLEYKDTGGQYANIQFTAPSKFDLKNGQSVFSIKLYVPSSSITGGQTNQVSLKLQNSGLGGNSWQTQTEIIKTIVLDEWQTVTFNFETDNWINLNNNGVDPDPVDRTDLDKVVIQLNSENNNDAVTGFIDDFYYGLAQIPESAPIVRDGFEGFGTIPAWVGDAAGANTSFANPFINSDNNSLTVLEYTDTGGQYANVNFTVTEKFNLVNKNVFSIMIYVPSTSISGNQNNQVSLKLQNSGLGGNSWQTQTEIIKDIVLGQWQTITFDFVNDNWINLNNNGVDPNPIDRTDLDKVVIQVNGENNNDTVTAYIDNVNYY